CGGTGIDPYQGKGRRHPSREHLVRSDGLRAPASDRLRFGRRGFAIRPRLDTECYRVGPLPSHRRHDRGVLALLLAARPNRIDKGDDDLTRHSAYRRRYRQSGAWRNAAAPNAVRRYFDIIEYRAHRFSAPFRGSGDGDRSQRGMKFKFTTAGESHGPALIAVVEGVPAGLEINRAGIDRELWRRQRGYGRGGRMKIEDDKVKILGGVRHGKALGSPISMMIENKDFVHWWDVMAVDALDEEPANPRKLTRPRPGHADVAG